MNLIKREIESRIRAKIRPGKVALIFGARRVGKTVLMRSLIDGYDGKVMVLNGEDADVQALLAVPSVANYRRLLEGVDLLAIDEAQNVDNIGAKLKLIVDEVPGVSVLASGSSSFDLRNKAGEPLVGRSHKFLLTPLSQREISTVETPVDTLRNQETRLLYGSYPEVVTSDNLKECEEYLREIVASYLLKDILAVDGVKNSSKMRDLLKLIAYQVGSEVSTSELGRQLGLSKNTVERYIDLLEQVFVVTRMGGFSRNLRKEVTKSQKIYFSDNGIRNAVIGDFTPMALRTDMGQLWENYLIAERRRRAVNSGDMTDFYFWRTYDSQEIDLIEERGGHLAGYEFKWGDKMPSAPGGFARNYPDAEFHVVNRNNYLDFLL